LPGQEFSSTPCICTSAIVPALSPLSPRCGNPPACDQLPAAPIFFQPAAVVLQCPRIFNGTVEDASRTAKMSKMSCSKLFVAWYAHRLNACECAASALRILALQRCVLPVRTGLTCPYGTQYCPVGVCFGQRPSKRRRRYLLSWMKMKT